MHELRVHTEQEQLHLSGGLLSVLPQVLINHFTPLHRSFVLGADRAAHFCFSLWNNLFSVGPCLQQLMGLAGDAVRRSSGRCELKFPSRGDAEREGGERRWHGRLVCHTVEPESGERLSQLQSTHCCLST